MKNNFQFRIIRSVHYRNPYLPVWRVENIEAGFLLGEFTDKGDLRLIDSLSSEDESDLYKRILPEIPKYLKEIEEKQ